MDIQEFNKFCLSKMPAGFIYVPCYIVVVAVPCRIRRERGHKRSIMHAAMLVHAALEARGIKVIHREVNGRTHQAEIWCDHQSMQNAKAGE